MEARTLGHDLFHRVYGPYLDYLAETAKDGRALMPSWKQQTEGKAVLMITNDHKRKVATKCGG